MYYLMEQLTAVYLELSALGDFKHIMFFHRQTSGHAALVENVLFHPASPSPMCLVFIPNTYMIYWSLDYLWDSSINLQTGLYIFHS